MKLLHYTAVYAPAWKTGGPVRSVSQICEGMADRGHEVTVLTTNFGLGDQSDIVAGQATERNGVRVTYFPAKTDLTGIRSHELETAVRERIGEFDIVHITGVWQPTSVAACRAAVKEGIPYVVSPRGALGKYSWTQKRWKKYPYWWLFERRNCREAAAVHCTTTMEATECQRFRLPGKPCLIPNSVGLDFWQHDGDAAIAWRSANSISPGTRLLLNAGRLHHKKGLDLLPDALAGLREENWKMVFVGSDDDGTQGQLQSRFADLGLTEKILFIDTVPPEELRALYSAADLFLLPSRHENFGNVVIEALSCRCPIIISDHVGVAGDLAGYEGVTILPNEATQWCRAIQDTPRGKVDVATVERLGKKFSLAAVAEAFDLLYSEIGSL